MASEERMAEAQRRWEDALAALRVVTAAKLQAEADYRAARDAAMASRA